jgi:cell division protein FtsB
MPVPKLVQNGFYIIREVFMKGEQALTLTQAANNNHAALEELKKENMELKNNMAKVKAEITEIKKTVEKLI